MHHVILDLLRVILAPGIILLFGFGILPIFKSREKNRRFLSRYGKFIIASGIALGVFAFAFVFQV